MYTSKPEHHFCRAGILALTLTLGLSLPLLVTTATAVQAQTAAPANDPTTLMKQAAALEAAGKWQAAAEAYDRAAKAYEAQGKSAEQARALEKSATMYEKQADELLKGGAPPPKPTAPAPVADQPGNPVAHTPLPAGGMPLPLDKSAIVHPNKRGALAVANANGRPLDGIKLSRHDAEIHNPAIVVAPNGAIHVAFVERLAQSPFTFSVYHRASSDGGKTWTEAKNLSEVMPDYQIGNCQIAADGAGRIYVVWRTGFGPNIPISGTEPHAAQVVNNLVYRVLDGGAWSGKAILVHKPATREQQDIGSASWFLSTDPGGKVHVVWNTNPDPRHPEALTGNPPNRGHSPAIKFGDVLEATLNGNTPTPEREIFQAKISDTTEAPIWPRCDDLDTLNGYVDANGQAHFVAYVTSIYSGTEPSNRFEIIENGTQKPAIELPGSASDFWNYPPQLLVDAQGRRHIIAMYPRGEQPSIQDYVVGSDAEPTIIRAANEVKGRLYGFQAYQGPGGRMVAIMAMNDTGKDTDDELYISTSSGGKWSAPVNITNNTGRVSFLTTQTSLASHVAKESYWYPGPAAATFDRSGHLVLVYICNEKTIVESNALGVTLAGGSTNTPKLLFLRF